MTDSYYHIDIRFAVFIIWALLFLVFIVFPLSFLYIDVLVRGVCHSLGCSCFGCFRSTEEEENSSDDIQRGRHYLFLSSAQKMELKRSRMKMIKMCLQKYSVFIITGKDTLLIKEDTGTGDEMDEQYCCTSDVENAVEPLQTQDPELNSKLEDDEENAQFTHVSIPHPGYDIKGFHYTSLSSTKKTTDQPTKTKKRCGYVSGLWSKRKRDTVAEQPQSKVVVQLTERRTASKCCAICLASYEPYDKISWSSNEGCTHVFHTECILTWLSALGDKWSANQRFTENFEPDELLRYSLECPCCRQDFVSDAVICAYCDGEQDELGLDRPVSPVLCVSEHSV